MSTEPDPFGPLEVHKKAQLAREMKQEEQE